MNARKKASNPKAGIASLLFVVAASFAALPDAAHSQTSTLATAPNADIGEIQILNLTPYTLTSVYVDRSEADESAAPQWLG